VRAVALCREIRCVLLQQRMHGRQRVLIGAVLAQQFQHLRFIEAPLF
jgi:hypothetical protein